VTATLLVVDDEPNILFSVEQCLAGPELGVITASTGREGIAKAKNLCPDVVLIDVRLPDMSGLDAFLEMQKHDPRLPVVLMTAYAKSEIAIEAMSRGAFDYLLKPLDVATVQAVINKALAASKFQRIPAILGNDDEQAVASTLPIVGQSTAMQEIYKEIGRIASQDAPVLILGESGTGKELVARAIYHYSRRASQPFLAINCAALPETLLESELFGHEKGAFTGADQRRIGKFEQVNGGTLFLDEIGDMSTATQAKALRLLQEQQFERLGGNTSVRTDVRIIAATNKNLHKLVEAGQFRLDLLYRLNSFTISIPPLRERKGDVIPLANVFIRRHSRECQRMIGGLGESAQAALLQHDWPGNVRELEGAIRYAVVHATGNLIEAANLPQSCREPGMRSVDGGETADLESLARAYLADGKRDVYRRLLLAVDNMVLKLAWDQTGGNQVRMCELLGLARMTMRSKLRACHLLEESAGPNEPQQDLMNPDT
jgi:DNA-binding NtrC family response regulator